MSTSQRDIFNNEELNRALEDGKIRGDKKQVQSIEWLLNLYQDSQDLANLLPKVRAKLESNSAFSPYVEFNEDYLKSLLQQANNDYINKDYSKQENIDALKKKYYWSGLSYDIERQLIYLAFAIDVLLPEFEQNPTFKKDMLEWADLDKYLRSMDQLKSSKNMADHFRSNILKQRATNPIDQLSKLKERLNESIYSLYRSKKTSLYLAGNKQEEAAVEKQLKARGQLEEQAKRELIKQQVLEELTTQRSELIQEIQELQHKKALLRQELKPAVEDVD